MATFTSYKTKDGKRKYKFKVYLGKDPLTGKRIETSRQGFNSKKEAQIALRNVQADFEKNGWKKQNNKLETFDDLFYFWLESFKNGSLSNRIGEELLGEALTVVTQLMLLFDLREKYNQCD